MNALVKTPQISIFIRSIAAAPVPLTVLEHGVFILPHRSRLIGALLAVVEDYATALSDEVMERGPEENPAVLASLDGLKPLLARLRTHLTGLSRCIPVEAPTVTKAAISDGDACVYLQNDQLDDLHISIDRAATVLDLLRFAIDGGLSAKTGRLESGALILLDFLDDLPIMWSNYAAPAVRVSGTEGGEA